MAETRVTPKEQRHAPWLPFGRMPRVYDATCVACGSTFKTFDPNESFCGRC